MARLAARWQLGVFMLCARAEPAWLACVWLLMVTARWLAARCCGAGGMACTRRWDAHTLALNVAACGCAAQAAMRAFPGKNVLLVTHGEVSGMAARAMVVGCF